MNIGNASTIYVFHDCLANAVSGAGTVGSNPYNFTLVGAKSSFTPQKFTQDILKVTHFSLTALGPNNG